LENSIIIGGFGGQGILFFGKILTFASMLEGKEVTWFPSYGAEMRGGTANCTVIISDELIGSPVVTSPDSLIVMSEASLKKFQPKVKQNGILIFDSSLINMQEFRTDIEAIGIPATIIANKIGGTKSANMVLTGAFIAKTGLLHKTSLLKAIEGSMPENKKKIIDINKKAAFEGIKYIENAKG
jgi:2-oxoglutarate ferredoxin oxidoreductase subunit gamma